MAKLKKVISGIFRGPRKLVTDSLFPVLFATLDHKYGSRRGVPLNGQSGRAAIIEAIVRRSGIEQIVETGTYRGASTAWFAEFGLPVHTVEANPRFAHFVRLRFANEPLVHATEMDSAAFLRQLSLDPNAISKTTLFYLDAHWGKHLPLGDEIRTVVSAFPHAVMVVDDFKVADDADYGFDDYGPGKCLDLDYVRRSKVAGLTAFFPVLRGAAESGARRGCVVLTASSDMADRLRKLLELRPFPI